MTAVWLRALLRWCERALFALALFGGGRVAYVAWQLREPTVTLTPAVMDDDGANKRPSGGFPLDIEGLRARLAPSMPSDLVPTESVAIAGRPTRPHRSQVYLVINVRPDRAELLINGVAHGHTPYVGEVSCQSGGNLSITVVPPKGMPKRFERRCDRREIRIDDSEPSLQRD